MVKESTCYLEIGSRLNPAAPMDTVLGGFLLPTKEQDNGCFKIQRLHELLEGPQPFQCQQICPL